MRLPIREYAGLSLGIEMVLSIVLPSAGGRWLDERFRTGYTFTLIGFVLGAAAGFRSLLRTAAKMDREDAASSPPTPDPQPDPQPDAKTEEKPDDAPRGPDDAR